MSNETGIYTKWVKISDVSKKVVSSNILLSSAVYPLSFMGAACQ